MRAIFINDLDHFNLISTLQELNCLVYDTEKLRNSMPYTTAGLLCFGVLCDIGVWYYCKNLDIYLKDGAEASQSKKKPESTELPARNGIKNSTFTMQDENAS